jgi:hypothetical protein
LHIGAVRRVHSIFIFEVPIRIQTVEVMLELSDGTTEIEKISTGEAGIE